MTGAAATPQTTFAALLWPRAGGRANGAWRTAALLVLGSCLLTLSAKVQVPGPVPMTLQTLAVMALGAMLGWRLALASVALYVAQGLVGLPVFANTPPLLAGPAYLLGPTGGFLLGFAVAAAIVGWAADRGLVGRPLVFAGVLALANVALLAVGCLWLGLAASVGGGFGLGFAKAFEIGVRPFLLANAIKLAIAAVALPLAFEALSRLRAR